MLPYNSIEEAAAHLGRNLTYAETLWFNYSSQKSDFFLNNHAIIFTFLIYSIFPLPILVINQIASFDKYKIQSKVSLSAAEIFKVYKHGVHTILFILLPIQIASYPAIKMVGIRTGLALPSGWEIVAQISVYFLIEDFMTYWIHRGLHSSPWLYDMFHKVHHEYEAPVAFSVLYNHWGDIFMLGFPSFVGPAIVPGHMLTLWLWFSVREMEAIGAHSGYDFPWDVNKLIRFYGGAEYHDYHHFVGGQTQNNFSSIFRYNDYIYGTNKGYRFHKKVIREVTKRGEEEVSKLD